MNIHSYITALENAAKKGDSFMCSYCGEQNFGLGGHCVCSNCELPIFLNADEFKAKNPDMFSSLKEMNEKAAASDYSKTIEVCDKLYGTMKDPAYLYIQALVQIKQSNQQTESIKYDREGFMEDNSRLRDNAAELASASKALLVSAIKDCEASMSEDRPAISSAYLTFLCQIKLSNIRGAAYAQQKVNKIDEKYLGAYSKMMLDANTGEHDDLIKNAEALLKPDSFSSNALFYIALTLFDKHKYPEARELIKAIKQHMNRSSIDALEIEINKADSI